MCHSVSNVAPMDGFSEEGKLTLKLRQKGIRYSSFNIFVVSVEIYARYKTKPEQNMYLCGSLSGQWRKSTAAVVVNGVVCRSLAWPPPRLFQRPQRHLRQSQSHDSLRVLTVESCGGVTGPAFT